MKLCRAMDAIDKKASESLLKKAFVKFLKALDNFLSHWDWTTIEIAANYRLRYLVVDHLVGAVSVIPNQGLF